MFHLDTFRLIKKTKRRFLTIFLMVFIGVCFMVGLLSITPIMKVSVDDYYDEYNFMDVQLYSSYGFEEADIESVKDTDGVKDVFASKFTDVLGVYKDVERVVRVQELDSPINQFELLSGRLPRNENEALVLGSSDFNTLIDEGDSIQLYLEDGDVFDSLKHDEYEIVGTIRAPQYMANSLETSTLNNLDLSTIIYVNNDELVSEYYTTMYVVFDDSSSYTSFTKKYKNYIKECIDELEDTAAYQQDYRKNKVIEEIEEEIEKGERELENETSSAQKKIDDGMKELDAAYIQLLVGKMQLEAGEKELIAGEKEIEANEKLLLSSKQQIDEGIKQVEEQFGSSLDEAVEQVTLLYNIYTMIDSLNYEDMDSPIDTLIENNNKEIADLKKQNIQYEIERDAFILAGDFTNAARIGTLISKNKLTITQLEADNAVLLRISESFSNISLDEILNLMDEKANGSVKDSYQQLITLQEGKKQVEEGIVQLEAGKKELEAGRKEINASKKELEDGQRKYESGLKELTKAQLLLDQEKENAYIELEKARQQLEELPDSGWMILDRDSHYSSALYDNNAAQMQKIGTIFPLLFFLVAALVCMTTMKRLVDEQRSQIGVFSALGFTPMQIIMKYVIYAFCASIISSLLGMFAGVPTFPVVIYVCWRLMYDLPDIHLYLPLFAGVIGVLSFTILMCVVTFFVAKGSLNEMPSQLMRPKAPKKASKVFLEYMPFIWNHLSFTSKVTARNLIRYKSRFFMTIIGITGCTMLLCLGFGVKDSISNILDDQYGGIFKYDYTVECSDFTELDYVLDDVEDHKDVDEAIPYMSYSTKVYLEEEKTMNVIIVDEDKYDEIFDLRERKTKKALDLDDGIIINEKFAKANKIKVGDSITIESSHGIKKEVEIEGICELYFQHYLFISESDYEKIFNETVRYELIGVVCEELDDFIDDMEDVEGIDNITDFSSMKARFKNMIEALDIIVIVILLASGSLALVVLINLTEVNISERIREIATLKVLGFNDLEVNNYIFKEIILLTLIGAILGLPIGKVVLGFVMDIIDMEMMMFGNEIKILSYLFSFMITVGFAILVMFMMRKSLRNVEMVESLKSVE